MTVDTVEPAPPRYDTAAPAGLAERAHAAGTTFILALFVTLTGKPCAKLVPVEAVDLLATEGVGFAGYAAGAMGQVPKDPDLIAIPDPASFTPIPFVQPGLAIVHCDPHVNGKPWPYAPRVILKETLRVAAEQGLSVNVGAEIEYFLVRRDEGGGLSIADHADRSAQPCYDARGVTRMYDHLAGILDHACALQAVVAPTVNSYKRTGAVSTSSGATWAPQAASYGGNDRTHYVRVPDHTRVELRAADGSANPYLAVAAAVGAGLDGIGRQLDPGAPGTATGAALPKTLLHAIEAFEADPVLTETLDRTGAGVAAYFADLKREEFFDWHNTVSPWEIDRYLAAF